MKTKCFLSILVLTISLSSCHYAGTFPETNDEDVNEVSITIEKMENEDILSRVATSADANFTWERNDTLGIFPSTGGQVEFPITEEGIGKSNANFTGGGWALKANYSYSAYYPFNFYNRIAKAIPISYLGQVQDGNQENPREHLSGHIFLASAPSTVNNGVISFPLSHAGSVLNLNLTLPVATTYTSATVFTDAKIIPVKKTIDLQDDGLTQTATALSDRLTLKLENITTASVNEEVSLWMAFPSMAEANHTLKVVVYDKDGFTYVADIYKADRSTLATASFTKNKYQNRYASPTLKEGFNFGVGNWESDGEHKGSVE